MSRSSSSSDLASTLCTITVYWATGVPIADVEETHCSELAKLRLIEEKAGRWYPAPAVLAASLPVHEFTRYVGRVRRAQASLLKSRGD